MEKGEGEKYGEDVGIEGGGRGIGVRSRDEAWTYAGTQTVL